jgi:serine acetyltransferase
MGNGNWEYCNIITKLLINMKTCPASFKECFYFDESDINPTPPGFIKKICYVFLVKRYSMHALMRISQYLYVKSSSRGVLMSLSGFLRRLNQILNQFTHGADPEIEAGFILMDSNITITSSAVIETGVQIYGNVNIGSKSGKAPHICRNARIYTNSVVIGDVVVEQGSVVGAGAVVVKDVPEYSVVAGVPAKIIKELRMD